MIYNLIVNQTSMDLVTEIEKAFEPLELQSETTSNLNRWLSNNLMPYLPRISPALFAQRRVAKLELSPSEEKRFSDGTRSLLTITDNKYSPWFSQSELSKLPVKTDFASEIPYFVLADLQDWGGQKQEVGVARLSQTINLPSLKIAKLTFQDQPFGYNDPIFRASFSNGTQGYSDSHLDMNLVWTSVQSPRVYVDIPQVPDKIRDLGYRAVELHQRLMQSAPEELRRNSLPSAPQFGVVWAPIDESLIVNSQEISHAKGNAAETRQIVQKQVLRSKDPLLVLSIPCKEQRLYGSSRYAHVVASWNIGEELPFRNWLDEYTDGGRKQQ